MRQLISIFNALMAMDSFDSREQQTEQKPIETVNPQSSLIVLVGNDSISLEGESCQ